MNIKFEWDPAKAEINLRKHHVSFEVATRVFADPFAAIEQDRIEKGEHRWQTVGLAKNARRAKNVKLGCRKTCNG